jgi:hypothetical protein
MFDKICTVFSLSIVLLAASGQAFAGSYADTTHHVSRHADQRSRSAIARPESNDIHFNYKFDVLWDWTHRYPPGFLPPASSTTVGVVQPVSGDTNFTYTVDVPWDWAHRYPPGFLAGASDTPPPPPVIPGSGCRVQDVTVGPDKQQTVAIIRC